MRKFPTISCTALAAFFLFAPSAFGGLALTATLGSQSYAGFRDPNFGYSFSAYYKFDEQVWLGLQSGQGVSGFPDAVPLLGAAYVRLPMGRVIMPVWTGEAGYVLSHPGFVWRMGGLLDIRNGRHSSLLLGSEFERNPDGRAGVLLRGGLLLEL